MVGLICELEVAGFLSESKYIESNADALRTIIYTWTGGQVLENLTRVDARWINCNRGQSKHAHAHPFGSTTGRDAIILDVFVNIVTKLCRTDPNEMLREKYSDFGTMSPFEMFSVIFDHQPRTLPDGTTAGRKEEKISSLKATTNIVLLMDELLKTVPLTSTTNGIRTFQQRRHAKAMNISMQDHDTIHADYTAPSLAFFGEDDSRPSILY